MFISVTRPFPADLTELYVTVTAQHSTLLAALWSTEITGDSKEMIKEDARLKIAKGDAHC